MHSIHESADDGAYPLTKTGELAPADASLLVYLFKGALEAAKPEMVLPAHLPVLSETGRSVMVAFGKAAAAMAAAALAHYKRALPGIVVTRYGHSVAAVQNIPGLTVYEAAHPVPDIAGQNAAQEVLSFVGALEAEDHLLCLVSGGGSALMTLPGKGIELSDKQTVTQALLRSGASIDEINCVRKHLSAIKGGRLALVAAPAKITTLIISDVVGDDPSLVASGPTVPDVTTLQDAKRVLQKYNIDLPASIETYLAACENETPKETHTAFLNCETKVVANASLMISEAARLAEKAGYKSIILGDDLIGNAAQVAAGHALLAQQYKHRAERVALISGGELTVEVNNPNGKGGPNTEYLLALALALDGAEGIHALACDTDGIDGTEDNAGAVIDPTTLSRAKLLELDATNMLAENDSYMFFKRLDDLVITGPTRTNVNDLRIILVDG